MFYDKTKPRFTVIPFDTEMGLHSLERSFEVLNPNEVEFWRSIGYTIEKAVWNPQRNIFTRVIA